MSDPLITSLDELFSKAIDDLIEGRLIQMKNGVKTMEDYQKLRGEIHGLELAKSEFMGLMRRYSDDDEIDI